MGDGRGWEIRGEMGRRGALWVPRGCPMGRVFGRGLRQGVWVMAVRTYLPRREADLRMWSINFASKISADPAAYGLTVAQAAEYQVAQSAYAAAYAVAKSPVTRSPSNVGLKNLMREELIRQTRVLVEICQAWPGMTDAKRISLGITVRRQSRTRTPRPRTAPTVHVTAVDGRLLKLKLREPGSDRRGKPATVGSARLYTYVGEEEPTTLEGFRFHGSTGRTDTQVVLPASVLPGSKVWVSACWVNTAGKPGPASIPVMTWTNHGVRQLTAA